MSMLADLYRRIEGMDRDHPYVWKLRISAAEFNALEQAVLTEQTTALQNVVYLAEWYRRCYDGGEAKPVKEFDCQQLFKESGINLKDNLFETESGISTWRYSIYVLGGVAIPFECNRSSKKFLKELCRIYYGEDGDVDKLGGKERAVAFKESVRTCGCLYEFLKEVLSPDPPFAGDDLADPGSLANQLISKIKSANDEILKSKFDLEWIIGFDPNLPYMTRRLRLILKPESLGGLNHQYLKFGRVELWNISCPEKIKRIIIGVRFLQDETPVAGPDFSKPILEYAATGSRETGFVAWYTERHSKKTDVPVERFNKVEILARDDLGKEQVVQTFKVEDWMQVFRVPNGYNEWTSQHCAQRDSAVICSSDFEMLDVGPTEMVYKKKFWLKGGGVSDVYLWRTVYDTIRFKDVTGREIAIFNRQGYDQIVARLHHDILRYHNGCVNYVTAEEDEVVESYLPLVFTKDDLIVRHFESRNDMSDGAFSEKSCEKIEFLAEGRYLEWTNHVAPSQGATTLRITIKGVQRKLAVYCLPITISRDCEMGKIYCGEEPIDDPIVQDGIPADPVFHKSVGTDEAFVSLEIWRATTHKEIIRGNKVVKYVKDGETVEISYALRDGLKIHDFSMNGYREYCCSDLGNIYGLPEFRPVNESHLAALSNGKKVQVSAVLDGQAPDWLWVNLAKASTKTPSERMFYWDYRPGHDPQEVGEDASCQGDDIIFHSLKDYEGLCVEPPMCGEPDPFGGEFESDLVNCFEVATTHGVYYFALQPFKEPSVDLQKDLYIPLLNKRGGTLTDEDRQGLLRLAEEFGFDWRERFGITVC